MVTDGQFSPIQVVNDFLERIQQIDPMLNSYITVSDTALQEASKAGKSKYIGPLHGVPISAKDIILSQNMPTTAGSKVFGKGLAGGDAPALTAEQQSQNDAGTHKWVYTWNESSNAWDLTDSLV